MKILIAVLIAVAGLGAGGWWYMHRDTGPGVTFRSEELKRGPMVPTISATGTVEPLDTIDVGAQVAGQIMSFGNDTNGKMINYGSPIKKGMMLATIDTTLYKADLESGQANVAAAQAQVKSARANSTQYKAQLVNAASTWKRAQDLHPGDKKSDAISDNDFETARAANSVAEANVELGEALIAQAEANVRQQQAQLGKAEQNMKYCTINSPIDGVIIDRRVNVGQTVVSSLNTPSLFLIAKDPKQIQVWVSVNEADIGKVYPGQPVKFSVDEIPDETFDGVVGRVRLNAMMTQNVVTYTVEVNTPNLDGRLLLYTTANVQFEVDRRPDVWLAPNAALQWYPKPEMVAPDIRKTLTEKAKTPPPAPDAAGDASSSHHKKRSTTNPATSGPASTRPAYVAPHGKGTVWVMDGLYVRPIKVRTGATDGFDTEISPMPGEELKPGMQLVTGEQHQQNGDEGTTNPFAPKPMWGKKKG